MSTGRRTLILARVGLPVFVAGSFGLELMAQWWTWLLVSDFVLFYSLFRVVVFIGLVVAMMVSAIAWARSRRNHAAGSHRNWLISQGCAILLALGMVGLNYAYARGLPAGSCALRFEPEIWREMNSSRSNGDDISVRQKMLGDMIDQVRKVGRKEDAIRLLGPSEDEGYFDSAGEDLIYRMGMERESLFPIDSEWLLIWFDERGELSRYEIWTD